MKNTLRLLVLSGMLALLASPAAFADGNNGPFGGPGGSVPPTGGGTTTTNTTNGSSTAGTILGEIWTILQGFGL